MLSSHAKGLSCWTLILVEKIGEEFHCLLVVRLILDVERVALLEFLVSLHDPGANHSCLLLLGVLIIPEHGSVVNWLFAWEWSSQINHD